LREGHAAGGDQRRDGYRDHQSLLHSKSPNYCLSRLTITEMFWIGSNKNLKRQRNKTI
jgi:hypothetical protein